MAHGSVKALRPVTLHRDIELAEEVGIPGREQRPVRKLAACRIRGVKVREVVGDDTRVLRVPRLALVATERHVDGARIRRMALA